MSTPRVVMIAAPCKGGLSPYFNVSLFNLILSNKDSGYHFEWSMSCAGSIAIARDELASRMLEMPECTGILMIDADMKWLPEHIYRILSHNLPIVGGTYARKEIKTRWVMTGIMGEEVNEETGLIKVLEIGTGFLFIAREVFEKMIKELPEIEHVSNGKIAHNFFWQGVADKRFYGEDYGFCYNARRLGFDIFADTKCMVPHSGQIDFPLPDATS